jgi:hypothetical protein
MTIKVAKVLRVATMNVTAVHGHANTNTTNHVASTKALPMGRIRTYLVREGHSKPATTLQQTCQQRCVHSTQVLPVQAHNRNACCCCAFVRSHLRIFAYSQRDFAHSPARPAPRRARPVARSRVRAFARSRVRIGAMSRCTTDKQKDSETA